MKKRVLGDEKPLNGGDYIDAVTARLPTFGEQIMEVPVTKVRIKENVRQGYDATHLSELAESIRQIGLLQPITVTPAPDGFFDIVFGHRRYRAVVLLGQGGADQYTKIKCIVKERTAFDVDEVREVQMIENIQRENLSAGELKDGMEYLKKRGLSYREIAERLGKTEGYVKNIFMTIRAVNESPELEAVLKSHTGVTLADIQTVRPLPLKYQLDLLSAKAEGNITSRMRLEERVQELKEELHSDYRQDRAARQRFDVMAVRPDGSLKVKSFLVQKDKLNSADRDRLRELVAALTQFLEGKDA